MNNRPLLPGPSTRYVPWLAAALAALLTITALAQLRRTAPRESLDLAIPAAEDPAGQRVTCERRMPSRTEVSGELPPPAGRITSTEVVECPDHFDGQAVELVGEVIGDVLEREGGAWLLVNDDAYALDTGPLPGHQEYRGANTGLAVWLPEELLPLIGGTGGPGQRGTVLHLVGVLHRVDPDDGGGLTLRAFDASVVAEARSLPSRVHVAQLVVALLLAALAVGLVLLERVYARRR